MACKSQTNNQTLEFEIKQSNIMNDKCEQGKHKSLNIWPMKNMRPYVLNKEDHNRYQED